MYISGTIALPAINGELTWKSLPHMKSFIFQFSKDLFRSQNIPYSLGNIVFQNC